MGSFIENKIIFFFTEEVIKCLTKPAEKIRISCPRGYVIYKPMIVAGSSASQSCNPSPVDCIGSTKEIKRQTDNCFWKKKCLIKLCNVGSIAACKHNVSSTTQPTSHNISYIIIKKVSCIPKGKYQTKLRTLQKKISAMISSLTTRIVIGCHK